MVQRCKTNNIHFWPVALEGDGVATNNFLSFFNHVCDAARIIKGVNRANFKSYFLSRLSNTLHQVSARLALRATASARARLVHIPGPEVGLQEDLTWGQELQAILPAFVSKKREWRNRNSNQGVSLRNWHQ